MFTIWSLWYGSEAIFRPDMDFMHTRHIFYPGGISLFFCNYYYYGVFWAFLFRGLVELPFLYNTLLLQTFLLSAVGAFFLVHYLTKNIKASIVGGFIFAFNPSHFAHSLYHLGISSIQFVPFFVLFFIRALKEKKISDIFLSAFFLTLCALCDWNYLVYGFIFILVAIGYLVCAHREKLFVSIRNIFLVLSLTFLFLSPLIVPMLLASLKNTFVSELPGHDLYVADLVGFFVPHPYHFLSTNSWVDAINRTMTGNDCEKTVYLGVINLLLVLVTLAVTWKENRKYFFGLLFFMVMAMGVAPHILGKSLPFPLPYRLIQELPFFTQARNPSRIIVYAYLFLAVLAAFSIKHWLSYIQSEKWKKAFFLVVFLLVFADFYAVASATTPVSLPVAYQAIQKDTDKDFGILELPWEGGRYMMYQTMHGIPSVQGYMGRRFEKALSDTMIFDLRRLSDQKEILLENRIKYIVIYKRRMDWKPLSIGHIIYQKNFDQVVKVYDATYQKIYEDEMAATFQVY